MEPTLWNSNGVTPSSELFCPNKNQKLLVKITTQELATWLRQRQSWWEGRGRLLRRSPVSHLPRLWRESCFHASRIWASQNTSTKTQEKQCGESALFKVIQLVRERAKTWPHTSGSKTSGGSCRNETSYTALKNVRPWFSVGHSIPSD